MRNGSNMKRTLISVCVFVCGLLLQPWAGAERTQAEDVLLVDGEEQYIRADPLNRYLSVHCPYKKLERYVNEFCLPNWPNYTKYWVLKDGILYLERIETTQGKQYPLELLIPWYEGRLLKAHWFSGIVSYRKDDSPKIMLNREYYLEENVIRFVDGKEVERFTINHRERWLTYARRIMDEYYPAAGYSPDVLKGTDGVPVRVVDFLDEAFSIVTRPKKQPHVCPVIDVRFNADVEDFRLTEAHGGLSSYKLLEAIAMQTRTDLSVSVSNRVVIYEIHEKDAVTATPLDSPASAAETEDDTPAS